MSKIFDLTKPYEPKPFLDIFNLGLKEPVTFEDSKAVIVPFGYEGTVTFGSGTSKGPAALIKASYQVETFDDELLDDIHRQIKIWTTRQPELPKGPEEACKLLKQIASELLIKEKFPVVIGGEHSISYGFAQALAEKYPNLSVLVFDSHLDLGDQWSGRDFTHAAWLKHSLMLPNVRNASLVGIRNFNKLEYKYWQENQDRVKVWLAKDRKNWNTGEIINSLGDNVFISFDIDCFDASLMPATGTPEPGGPGWDEILPIIREVCKRKNIIGMDLVELAPIKGLHAPDFVAAKLLMKMILYKFCSKKFSKSV